MAEDKNAERRPPPDNVYRGEALRAVAMPLGGLGTGSIALAGDGSLRQWQIHNQVNHAACLPHSFFAVWAKEAGGRSVARVLQSAALYETQGPPPPPTSSDHVVPDAHRDLLARLRGVDGTEFRGRYPIGEVRYHDAALPVEVSLEAFNPFIPLRAEDSGIPAIVFNFTVTNPTDRPVRASVAATLQNGVGWDGAAPIVGVACPLYGGNFNAEAVRHDMTLISMSRGEVGKVGEESMALATLTDDAGALAQWDDLEALWKDFSADGRFDTRTRAGPSQKGRTWNAALAVPLELEAGGSQTVTFLVTWYFPNRTVNWSQGWLSEEEQKTRPRIGNHYNTRFGSALEVSTYVAEHFDRLSRLTRLARDTFYDTTLPEALIDSVTSQMSIVRTPTCFWTQDGRFFGFEGCCGASTSHHAGPAEGCCPLNCTHVWNYEMALSRLFPSLERTMRETEWLVQQHPTGYLPHRVVMPLFLPRLWGRKIGGPEKPALDGLLGAILKTYREYRASGDAEWLRRMWRSVKKALEHLWTTHDPEKRGTIEGEQPNTYDISIYGANTFIGTLYLATLRAVERMADLMGEDDLAAECRRVFERGRTTLEERLWNGEYYIQDVDLETYPEQNWATGCHSDQLLGQWWAHVLGLGYVLDPEHVRTAARSIFCYNFRDHFRGHKQQPRQFVTEDDPGLLMCSWPNGGRPEVPTQYSDEIWTGIEYEVAALLLFEGEVEPALEILKATRARHDGRKENPWNDVECGDHYVRAMASWAILEAASGFTCDAGAAHLGFAPVLAPMDFRAPFFARDGWGTFAQKIGAGQQIETVTVAFGSLEVQSLRFSPQIPVKSATVTADGQEVAAALSQTDGDAVLTLSDPVTVRAGRALTVTLS